MKRKVKTKRVIPDHVREAASEAMQGNQWWALRSKHGRDKLFATPELMWEAACDYFQWVDDNPFIEHKSMVVSIGDGMGSNIQMAEIPVKRPYTMQGICLYMDCGVSFLRNFKNCLGENDKDFKSVIEKIEEVIYNQKFSGAASGFFNANIIARDLGLRDQTDMNVNDSRKAVADLFPPLPDED